MDEYKLRAKEKFDAIHVAAITAAGSSKTKVEDVLQHTAEVIKQIRESFLSLWHHELIAESRLRVSAWSREALQRIKEGALPLSPMHLYDELVALLKDRVWRRSVVIFGMGVVAGAACGAAVAARLVAAPAPAPHARALLADNHTQVMLVEDATTPAAGVDEVLVRVQAFSVAPVDRCVLRGRGAALRQLINRTQQVVGRGWAGVVLDAGPGGAGAGGAGAGGALQLGDAVWGVASEWAVGAAAELYTTRCSRVSRRARGLSADAAAALPWAGVEALRAYNLLNTLLADLKTSRVAVCGASSSEGCLLVQLLSAGGAHVTAHAPAHTRNQIMKMGATTFIESEGSEGMERPPSWAALLEQEARRVGPWDAVLLCASSGRGPDPRTLTNVLLKARAPRSAMLDIRPQPLLTDRLPIPFSFIFVATFYTYRLLRWVVGCGGDTDWLEPPHRLSPALAELADKVDSGVITPVLNKVYLPQDYETALSHACSDDAVGTIVVRFP